MDSQIRVVCYYCGRRSPLSHYFFQGNQCENARAAFESGRSTVTYLRKSHRQAHLSKKLQLFCVTRWNSAATMLGSFLDVRHELLDVLSGEEMESFLKLDLDLVNDMHQYFAEFKKITELLSAENEPTLHLVVPSRLKLIRLSTVRDDDHPALKSLKEYYAQHIEEYWLLQDQHWLALLCHPKFRQLHFCDRKQKKKVHDLLRADLKHRSQQPSPHPQQISFVTAAPTLTTGIQLPSNEITAPDDIFDDFYDRPISNVSSKCELDDYLSADFAESEFTDLIFFWKKNAERFPIISSLAIELLCIPASNTAVERLFSYSGNTITCKRTRLGVQKLNKLMFLKRNMMTIKNLVQGSISNDFDKLTEKRLREGPSVEEGEKRKRYRRDSSDEDNENEAKID